MDSSFGDWLAGFTDGEGCFYLHWQDERLGRSSYGTAAFGITLRSDDAVLLSEIARQTRVGLLHPTCCRQQNRRPAIQWKVKRVSDLRNVIVPIFEQHPLRGKKSTDFVIWRDAVQFLHDLQQQPRGNYRTGKKRWSTDNAERFKQYVAALTHNRVWDRQLKLAM